MFDPIGSELQKSHLGFPGLCFALFTTAYRDLSRLLTFACRSFNKSLFVRFTFLRCICLVALFVTSERACAQLMQLEYKVPKLVIESPEEVPSTLWERFDHAFRNNSEKIFSDRFHSINTLNWYLDPVDGGFESFGDRGARTAAGALSRSVVTGFREAAIDLPFMDWLDGQRGFVVDLLMDSLDTVEEESVNPLNPSYRILEKSWWKRLSESRGFRYGLRPFQISPYAFASAGIWNKDSLIAMTHLRYHYRQFSEHQFEMAVSVPLSRGVALDVGAARILGREADSAKLVLKLSKQFKSGGIVHVGMEAKDRPAFLVGMSVPL